MLLSIDYRNESMARSMTASVTGLNTPRKSATNNKKRAKTINSLDGEDRSPMTPLVALWVFSYLYDALFVQRCAIISRKKTGYSVAMPKL